MRPLSSHFAHDALPTLDAFMKQIKKARVFRRAQAVREVVDGQTVKAVSETFHFTNSALRKWVKRFAREGTHGLLDRPRSGRPATMTSQIETQLHQLVDQDPLHHGSIHSQWSCHELASVLSQQSGVPIGRESVRLALKKIP
jgi:transposase